MNPAPDRESLLCYLIIFSTFSQSIWSAQRGQIFTCHVSVLIHREPVLVIFQLKIVGRRSSSCLIGHASIPFGVKLLRGKNHVSVPKLNEFFCLTMRADPFQASSCFAIIFPRILCGETFAILFVVYKLGNCLIKIMITALYLYLEQGQVISLWWGD